MKGKAKKTKGLTDKEFTEKIDTYQKLTTEIEDGFKLEEIKQKYNSQIKKSHEIQNQQEIYHGLGERVLKHTPLENVKDTHRYIRQKYRDQLSKEAKDHYDAKMSLEKKFSVSKNSGKSKTDFNKGIDLER